MFKIMDIFRPRYKHSDPHVREKAVREIGDSGVLYEVATTDNSDNVRNAAIEVIADEKILLKCVEFYLNFLSCANSVRWRYYLP